MDIAQTYGTSPSKELDGVWFWYDEEETCGLLLRRFNNPKHRSFMRRVPANNPIYRRLIRGVVDDQTQDMIDRRAIDALVETIIVDWKGIREHGKIIEYSKENAHRLLTTYPEFREDISNFCQQIGAYQEVEDEEMEGNSASTSGGSTDTATVKGGSKS